MAESRILRRAAALLAALAVGSLVGAPPSAAQVPPIPTPTPLPLPTASPSPSPEPSPSPSPSPTVEPSPSPAPEPFVFAPPPEPPPFALPPPTPAPVQAIPVPAPVPAASAPPALTVERALPGAYALGVAGLLAAGVLMPAGVGVARPRRARRIRVVHARLSGLTPAVTQEVAMQRQTRRWRLIGGATLVAVAFVVAIVGYLKISLEPNLARQIPILASAGLATLILVVTGGALLVADQIRAEDDRVDEIERSLERLAELVGPSLEAPPRVAGRKARAPAETG